MTASIRGGDPMRRDTLRMAASAAYNAQKAAGRPLNDDEMLGVLSREVKQRHESVEAYRRAGREELAAREEAELAVLREFLPPTLDEAELREMVHAAIEESGATSARDLGRVMSLLAPRTRGRADGRAVSALVAQELARLDIGTHQVIHERPEEAR